MYSFAMMTHPKSQPEASNGKCWRAFSMCHRKCGNIPFSSSLEIVNPKSSLNGGWPLLRTGARFLLELLFFATKWSNMSASLSTPASKEAAIKDADVTGTFEVRGLDASDANFAKAACVVVKSGRMFFYEDASVRY
jgi:hypothetical protein